jgi:hypothetical protein
MHRDKPARLADEHSGRVGVDERMNSILIPRPVCASATAVLSAAALALTGCSHRPIVVQTPSPTVIQEAPPPAPAPTVMAAPAPVTPPPVIVVNQAPPAPRAESASPQPSPQHVWIPGYWAWRSNQQQWIEGHWEIPPHPGATWMPARWDQRGSEYVFTDGYWQ